MRWFFRRLRTRSFWRKSQKCLVLNTFMHLRVSSLVALGHVTSSLEARIAFCLYSFIFTSNQMERFENHSCRQTIVNKEKQTEYLSLCAPFAIALCQNTVERQLASECNPIKRIDWWINPRSAVLQESLIHFWAAQKLQPLHFSDYIIHFVYKAWILPVSRLEKQEESSPVA